MDEKLENWGVDLLTGKLRKPWHFMLRGLLWCLSGINHLGVCGRLYLFRHGYRKEINLGVMVISIGNITTGGTGKTPVVEMVAKELRSRGRNVAIISRGYKSAELPDAEPIYDIVSHKPLKRPAMVVSDSSGMRPRAHPTYAGDEPYMLAKNLDGVSVIIGRDRVASGRLAIRELGADTLLLDDGLQYIRLHHRMDIILVDSKFPFGNGHLLPRGFLREPIRSLRRASYVFLTRCDEEQQDENLIRTIQRHTDAGIVETTHKAKKLVRVDKPGEELALESLAGKTAILISGIARPTSFEKSLEPFGLNLFYHHKFADHHAFEIHEIQSIMRHHEHKFPDMIITTEKDAVRLPKFDFVSLPVYFLRIEIEIVRGHEIWQHCLKRMCPGGDSPATHEAPHGNI